MKKFIYTCFFLVLCLSCDYQNGNSDGQTTSTVTNKKNIYNQSININFQPKKTPALPDYHVDYGKVFQKQPNGLSYGWNIDVSKHTRDRKKNSAPDTRYNTLAHFYHPDQKQPALWEITLPNGKYEINLAIGDASYCLKNMQVYLEQKKIRGNLKKCKNFNNYKTEVIISDGRLTLETNTDNHNARINFIEIQLKTDQLYQQAPAQAYNLTSTALQHEAAITWKNPLFNFQDNLVLLSRAPITYQPTQGVDSEFQKYPPSIKRLNSEQGNFLFLEKLSQGETYFINLYSFDKNNNYSQPSITTFTTKKLSKKQISTITLTLFEKLIAGASPNNLYKLFNKFAQLYFPGEFKERLKALFSELLMIQVDSTWQHVSRYSSVIGFQTNLPSNSYIRYGQGKSFDRKTAVQEREFFTHLHYLKGLSANTHYSYQIIINKQDGQTTKSVIKTFKTGLTGNVIELPTYHGVPLVLKEDNTTYLLTENILSYGNAIEIDADNITLDLGGNTITVDRGVGESKFVSAIIKNNTNKKKGHLKILNGSIAQANSLRSIDKANLSPVYINNQQDMIIAGLSIDFHTAQTYGIFLRYPKGGLEIHHNNFTDKGYKVTNRHGASGARTVYLQYAPKKENQFKIFNNLVKRSRQNGFSKAQHIYGNEIYIDSWSTNAFAIQPNSQKNIASGTIENNKIFLTGYHAIALSWAHKDLFAKNNLVIMQGINSERNRWFEKFGDQNSLNGIRLTNYGKGGQHRDHLHYTNNTIMGTARNGSMMRGSELFSDLNVNNISVENTFFDIRTADNSKSEVTAIVAHGTRKSNVPAIQYLNNTLSSNTCNIRFGDSYGRGFNHHFINSTIEKTTGNKYYHTIIFDGGYDTSGHIFRDINFIGGAKADDVYWKQTGIQSAYKVQWSLQVKAPINSTVKIYDVKDKLVYEQQNTTMENIIIPLTEMTIRPIEWKNNQSKGRVRKPLEHQKIMHTPHRVIVTKSLITKEIVVAMSAKKSVSY